jgi:hypothetical protein
MRHLPISDTCGKLGIIHELAVQIRADAVPHAADFGIEIQIQLTPIAFGLLNKKN